MSVAEWSTLNHVLTSAKPFDLVEINRYKGLYQHWAMYLGEGNVIHVTQVKGRTEGSLAEKRVDKLAFIARNDPCRINNQVEFASNKGLTPLTKGHILDAIQDLMVTSISTLTSGQGQGPAQSDPVTIVPYTYTGTNCEYYATLWKYGTGFSAQIEDGNVYSQERILASVEIAENLDEPQNRELIHKFMQTLC